MNPLITDYFESKKPFRMQHPHEGNAADFLIIECEPELDAAIISADTSVTRDGLGRVDWQWPISLPKLLDILQNQA
jgi:hypothetical protein